MKHQQSLVTLLVALLCSAVLVLFTDVEQDLHQQLRRLSQPGVERRGQLPSRIDA
ncbi:MAG: hypothetical protein ACPHGV_07195 [Synechococcus sp.]